MNSLKNVILISAGDPASISTEITIKAIENSKINKNIRPIVISSSNLIEDCKKNINSNIKLNEIKDEVNFSDYKENYLMPEIINYKFSHFELKISHLLLFYFQI